MADISIVSRVRTTAGTRQPRPQGFPHFLREKPWGRGWELGEIIAKNMAKTGRRKLGGRHPLFGEYLRSWSNLNVHYRR